MFAYVLVVVVILMAFVIYLDDRENLSTAGAATLNNKQYYVFSAWPPAWYPAARAQTGYEYPGW